MKGRFIYIILIIQSMPPAGTSSLHRRRTQAIESNVLRVPEVYLMRLMHIADLHLGAPMRYLGEAAATRRRERDAGFLKLIDIALKKADLLIISGDLFDMHDPDQALAGMVRSQLKRLRSGGVETVLVPGNHDEITYTASTYKDDEWDSCCTIVRCPRPEAVLEKEVAGERVFVCSCAYTGGMTTASDLRELPRVPEGAFGIIALHATVDMDLPGSNEDRAMKASSKDMERAGYSYAALGHIHKGRVWAQGGLTLAYPGIIDPYEFGDGAKGEALLVEVSDGKVSIGSIPVDGLERYADLEFPVTDLSPEKAAEGILAKAAGAKYLKARLTGSVPSAFSAGKVYEALAPHFGFLSIEDDALRLDPEELSNMARENSARGIFVARMLKLMEKAGDDEKGVLDAALKKGLEALRKGVGR